jgi:polysaccharide biosynthesis protein PslG
MSPLRWLLLVALTGSLLSCQGISSNSTKSSPPPGNDSSSGTSALFFGMQMNTGVLNQQPWPTAPFGTLRLWDTNTAWGEITSAPGVYNWSVLDHWLAMAAAHGVNDVMYTFGKTPSWASSNPNDTSCAAFWAPGACDPPNDLNPDGTGTDQHWKDFVTAIAGHAGAKIKYWEGWNEPENPTEWAGTVPQMVRMATDARTIILSINPNAVILTPPSQDTWFQQYVADGGVQQADVVTLHGYFGVHCGAFPDAAGILDRVNSIQATLAAAGINGKPLWDTEASWGDEQTDCFTDQDQRAAFLAQFYLLHLSANLARFYWYQWNNDTWGTLWSPTPAPNGTVLEPGFAYKQVYGWLLGSTLSAPCASAGTVWTCTFTRPNGYQAEAIWDTSQSCNGGNCTTSNLVVDPQYTKSYDLAGNSGTISDNTAAVGLKPIWLANQ